MTTDETKPPFELTREGYHRIRIRAGRHARTGKSQQIWITIATRDEAVALKRLARLREISAALTTQGLTLEARVALQKAAEQADDLRFELCCEAALELAPEVAKKPRAATWTIFRELAKAWTGGELHRRWPDHVAKKRSWKDDKAKLDYLCELVVDPDTRRKLGDMPLGEITFEHASEAMRQLPEECRRPATRRQYAQCIGRVLKLAVFPAACIAVSPLPPNFLPAVPEGDLVFPHLHPDEDLRLMRCAALEYGWRALFGLCNREGGRLGEFLRKLKWAGIDPVRGTFRLPGGLHRKGGKPSEWHAEPGSIEALEPLRALGLEGPFHHLPDDRKWSDRLQHMMRTAGLDREALFYSNVEEGFRRMRGHDTRATYITLALGSGLSEGHIMDRTAHTTSKMIQRYNRAAKALAASEAGSRLMPLDVALGLPMPPPRRPGWMTLDPRSERAEVLERLARVADRLLGPGGDGDDPGGGSPRGDAAELVVVEGELMDDELGPEVSQPKGQNGNPCGPADAFHAGAAARRASGPKRPAVAGLTTLPAGAREGETPGETNSGYRGACHAVSGKNGGRFDAACARQGSNLQCLAAPEPKSGLSEHDGADEGLSARNLVAGSDGNAHGVSPETGQVRREIGPPEAPIDPVLASLRAAAHAAVDAGDTATVAELMAVIEARLTRRAGAA